VTFACPSAVVLLEPDCEQPLKRLEIITGPAWDRAVALPACHVTPPGFGSVDAGELLPNR